MWIFELEEATTDINRGESSVDAPLSFGLARHSQLFKLVSHFEKETSFAIFEVSIRWIRVDSYEASVLDNISCLVSWFCVRYKHSNYFFSFSLQNFKN